MSVDIVAWCVCVCVAELRLRCPEGRKTKLYKRARLEKFAEYVLKDGLVCRLSIYDDNNSQSITFTSNMPVVS